MQNNIEMPIGTKAAAEFCGYSSKHTWRFLRQVNNGLYPGFRSGKKWLFFLSDLKSHMQQQSSINKAKNFPHTSNGEKLWQLAKRKTALTTTRDSQSAESEFKSQLNAYRKLKPSNMRKSAAPR